MGSGDTRTALRVLAVVGVTMVLMANSVRAQSSAVLGDRYLGATPEAITTLLDPVVRGRGGRIGVAVYSVDHGLPLYLHNADASLLPASNMKLYTTAAALDRMGPDYQYTTSVYGDGPLDPDGTLHGNLILTGRGDPTISGRFYGDSITYVFDRMAEDLLDAGVRRVRGRFIGDASYFDDVVTAEGWEERNLLWWYGARVSALSFNDNVVTLEISPGDRAGEPAQVSLIPENRVVEVVNRAVTGGRRGGRSIAIRRRPDLGGVEIWGRIPLRGSPLQYVVSVEDPAAYTLSVFRDRLERAGIEIVGRDRVIHDRNELPDRPRSLLSSHTSPRMIELVQVINKRSQNLFAEQVLKTMGAVFLGDGTFDDGGRVVAASMIGLGVAPKNFTLFDGSGLSRGNRTTARKTVELLVGMHDHRQFEAFYESLLEAGVDGDPRRLDAPEAVGNVRTKTGTLRGASALSGYVTTADGELLAFSVITNNLPRGKGASIALEDAIAERLARFSALDLEQDRGQ